MQDPKHTDKRSINQLKIKKRNELKRIIKLETAKIIKWKKETSYHNVRSVLTYPIIPPIKDKSINKALPPPFLYASSSRL